MKIKVYLWLISNQITEGRILNPFGGEIINEKFFISNGYIGWFIMG